MAQMKCFAQKVREIPDLDVCSQLEKSDNVTSLVNMLDNCGQGIIHYAIRFCKLKTLKLLFKLGVNPNLPTVPDGLTVFHICASLKFLENLQIAQTDWHQTVIDLVTTLLDAKCDPFKRNTVGSNCVHIAVREDNFPFLKAILNLRSSEDLLKPTNRNGLTCLHIAAKMENFKLCHFLLTKANNLDLVNVEDQQGQSPLHIAVAAGLYDIVELFLRHKCDVNHSSNSGETPLHLACQSSNCTADILTKLISSGALCNTANHTGDTPLHYACANHNFSAKFLSLLLNTTSWQMAMRHANRKGMTPLLIAASLGRLEFVKMLISYGSNTFDMDDRHNSILYLSAANNRWKTLADLLDIYDLKGLVNVANVDGSTPLHIASANGYEQIVKVLMRHCADPQLKDKWGQTAIMLASNNQHPIVTEILLDTFGCSKVTGKSLAEGNLISLAERLKSACITGCTEYIRAQLRQFGTQKRSLMVSLCHSGKQNCLQVAIEHSNVGAAEAIIESDWWKESLRSCTGTQLLPITPLRTLIEKYPQIAHRVFDKCIKRRTDTNQLIFRLEFLEDAYAIRTKLETSRENVFGNNNVGNGENEVENCLFTYENPFDSSGNLSDLAMPYSSDSNVVKDNHPVTLMVRLGRVELLNHPLVKSFLYQKWYDYGRFWFLFLLFLYLYFLFFLCGYLITTPAPYTFPKISDLNLTNSTSNHSSFESECPAYTQHKFARVAKYAIYAQMPLIVVKEICELLQGRRRYFSFDNLLEVTFYSFSLIFVLDFSDCARTTGIRTDFQYQLGCIAVFLAWVNLGLFLRKFRHVGIQIIVFTRILATFLEYATACGIFILAFGFVFYGLLQNQPAYETPRLALIKTASLVIDDFEIFDKILNVHKREEGGDVEYSGLTVVFFLLFLGLIVIIMMNMLVGLAVADIKEFLEKAKLRKLAMRAELIIDMETRMQNWKFLRSIMIKRGWIRRKLIVSLKDTNRDRLWSKLGDKWKFLKIFSFFRHRQNQIVMAALTIADRNRIAPVLSSFEEEKNVKTEETNSSQMIKTLEELKLNQNRLIDQLNRQAQTVEELKLQLTKQH